MIHLWFCKRASFDLVEYSWMEATWNVMRGWENAATTVWIAARKIFQHGNCLRGEWGNSVKPRPQQNANCDGVVAYYITKRLL